MAKYLSNRQRNLKIGIVSYTENDTVLEITGNANISGIVTATTYYGDGSQLTNIISGIEVKSNQVIVGSGITTIDFLGSGISTVTSNSGIASITIPGTSRTVSTYLATGGQTSFPATYSVGYVDVFLNGSKLSETQYTATNGTSINLIEGASLDDVIEIVGYNLFLSSSTPSLGIATSGGIVGLGITLLDFRGPGISTVTVSSGIGTINITGGGSASATPDISPVMMGMIF